MKLFAVVVLSGALACCRAAWHAFSGHHDLFGVLWVFGALMAFGWAKNLMAERDVVPTKVGEASDR